MEVPRPSGVRAGACERGDATPLRLAAAASVSNELRMSMTLFRLAARATLAPWVAVCAAGAPGTSGAAAQDPRPLRVVSITVRDVVDEDEERRLALHDLSLVLALDAEAGRDVVGASFELPGLSVPRFGPADSFGTSLHGFEGGTAAEAGDEDGDGFVRWEVHLRREAPFRLEDGDLRVELFGERSSARFTAALPALSGGAPERVTVLSPPPGTDVRAGAVITVEAAPDSVRESVTIETLPGPQRTLDLADTQPNDGTRAHVVPPGLYGPLRVLTVRAVNDELERDGVTIQRDAQAIAARWYVGGGDVLADLASRPPDPASGVLPIDQWTADPLGLVFSSFTRVPVEGGAVVVLGSHATTLAEVHRVKEVVGALLRDVPGADAPWRKEPLRRAMGDARAAFVIAYGDEVDHAYEAATAAGLSVSLVRAEGVQLEGSPTYLSPEGFDATFDDVLTAMMSYADAAGAAPHPAVSSAMRSAMARGVFTPGDDVAFPVGLYLATLAEVAFGQWAGAAAEDGRIFGGRYGCSTRSQLEASDPDGAALVAGVFGDRLDFSAWIDEGFEGRFHLDARADLPYTHRSRYLTRAALRGFFDADLVGNAFDNELSGNAGTNTLFGGAGRDVAVFQGARAEYVIEIANGAARVTDRVDARDGRDLCLEIEVLRFSDGEVEVQ